MLAAVPLDPTVRLAAAGDRAARKVLLDRHGPRMWSLCRRLSPDPEDAYQEIWEKVFRGLPTFDRHGRAPFEAWLATLAHRHLVDRHRRRKVRGDVLPFEDVAAPERDPDRGLDQARVEAALMRLPVDQRRVVVMHHLEDLPLDAIAASEGVAEGTVKSRLHRARARLAEWLGER